MDDSSLCIGNLLGFVGGAIIVWILYELRDARRRAGFQNNSLDAFPDARHPNMTPIGIVHTSRSARWAVLAWSALLIVVSIAIVAGVVFLLQI